MPKRVIYGTLIKQIHDELEKRANNALRAQGLTIGQVRALTELSAAPGKQLTLKELERRFHVAQSTAAGIAARLEQKGFVESASDPSDRRIKLVHITPLGEQCLVRADRDMIQAEEQLLSPLRESEKASLLDLLQKITKPL